MSDPLHWIELRDQCERLQVEVARLRRQLYRVEQERDAARHAANHRPRTKRRRWLR